MEKTPRQYSFVTLVDDSELANGILTPGAIYVYLGEIPNMLGHCIVIEHKTGKFYFGFHIENFRECTEDEI